MKTPNLRREAIMQRSRARRLLLQNLYQWQINNDLPQVIKYNRLPDPHGKAIDEEYYQQSFDAICAGYAHFEAQIAPFMHRRADALDPIERAILWIGVYELSARPDIPPTVVMNEAVELAKQFGAADSYKFINGILDKFSNQRPKNPPATDPDAEK